MSFWTQSQLNDQYGFDAECTPTDELRVITPYRLVGSAFLGTGIDSNFWITSGISGGMLIASGAQLTLDTTAGSGNSSAAITSVRIARYIAGSANRFRAALQVNNTGVSNNIRRWGAYSTTDGAFFELNGTIINAVTRRASTDTKVASASWNGSTVVPDITTSNTYEIYWTNTKAYFVINGTLNHTVSASANPWSDTMSPGIKMETINTNGVSTSNTIICRVAGISRLGSEDTQSIYKYQSGTTSGMVLKIGPGNLKRLTLSNIANTSVVTVYDGVNTNGNIIWSSGTMGNNSVPFSIDFDGCPFFTGLFLVVSTAASNVTVIYE
jgi:hypothetical protein